MTFLPDTRKQDIVSALMTGQRKIVIDGIEVLLQTLKRDTVKRKEIEANKQAEQILKLL